MQNRTFKVFQKVKADILPGLEGNAYPGKNHPGEKDQGQFIEPNDRVVEHISCDDSKERQEKKYCKKYYGQSFEYLIQNIAKL
jgi:hypothetical protein